MLADRLEPVRERREAGERIRERRAARRATSSAASAAHRFRALCSPRSGSSTVRCERLAAQAEALLTGVPALRHAVDGHVGGGRLGGGRELRVAAVDHDAAHARQPEEPELVRAVGLLRAVPVGVLAEEVREQRDLRALRRGRRSGSWTARAPSAAPGARRAGRARARRCSRPAGRRPRRRGRGARRARPSCSSPSCP